MVHVSKVVPVFTFFEHISSQLALVFDQLCELTPWWPTSRNRFCFVEMGQEKAASLVDWSNWRTRSNWCYRYFRQSSQWAGNLCASATGSVSMWHPFKRNSSNHFRLQCCLLAVSPSSLIPETFVRTERHLASTRLPKKVGSQ